MAQGRDVRLAGRIALSPPPCWSAADEGSFAQDTVARRMPEILAGTRRRLGKVPLEVDAALAELADELTGGALRGLREETGDRQAWDRAAVAHVGRRWTTLPWYFAESFFYRRILEATGYFGGSTLAGIDPFASHKAEEWAPGEGPRRVADLLDAAPAEVAPRSLAMLHGSLWGNRADLSYNVAVALGAFMGDEGDLLVDDGATVLAHLVQRRAAGPTRVAIIADNAGTECLMDLAFADHLLTSLGVAVVELHVKDHPFFVSDTIEADVDVAESALARSGRGSAVALGERMARHRSEGRLVVTTHAFYTSSAFYPALPDDLAGRLALCDLVVVKGDANYRRLVSDAPWAPETPFADVVADFPAPLCALRTMKAEVVVGLPAGLATAVASVDPRWMVNGRRGLIQARLASG